MYCTIKSVSSLIIIIFSCFSLAVYAQKHETQTKQTTEVKSLNKFGLFFPGIALEREQKITKSSTISVGVNYQFNFLRSYYITFDYLPSGGSIYYGNPKLAHTTKLKAVPGASINYRYYYNLEKRLEKSRKTDNNSANYISLDGAAIFPRLFNKQNQYDYQIIISPNWGLQRNPSKNTNGEFAIGPSLIINPYETLIGVGLKAGFSFTF